MSTRETGGPAFPRNGRVNAVGVRVEEASDGMTLRDYLAIHSTQPGVIEIAKAAGIGSDGYRVYLTANDQTGMPFNEWWCALPLEQLCDLSARVRYAQADAMLRERVK